MEFIAEEHHKNTFNRTLYFYILVLGLFLSLNLGSYLMKYGLQENIEWVKRSISDGFISLTVKFLNFCIAKFVSFRTIAYLETEASKSVTSWMFWIVLTCSISTLYSSI